ncbi:MAG: GNAT family N-acetyltransferase [Phycisphaerae bacterium]|nr:GNAT family N-acetyltransferase [Phycisphaerae bacterium]
MTLGHAGPEDIEAIVRLHIAAFRGFFLTSLGPAFLRLLYRSFSDMEGGICIVARNASGLLGFVAGTTEPHGFFRALLTKKGIRFALAAVPGLLCNPLQGVRKCLGALFFRGEQPPALPGAAFLSSLAVLPEQAGKGVGQALVLEFCRELRRRGMVSVYLVTDEVDNERANRFYEKCGFSLVDTFKRPGSRRMNRWAKHLRPAENP